MLAYLVIREGSKWTDVFRLIPGQSVTIGRAPTNQIVIKDERCSRCHAELFTSEGQWTLRDLDSRNGTAVSGTLIQGDRALTPGDVIRIGNCQLAFVHDLTQAFPEGGIPVRSGDELTVRGTVPASADESSVLDIEEPAEITHRRGQTKFLEPSEEEDEKGVSKVGRAAAKLCRLAFELAKAPDAVSMAKLALGGLFEGTQMDAGGLLLLRRGSTGEASAADLELVASRTETERPYHRVSPFLAATVLRESEAVLARNVMGDSTLGSRDSKGDLFVTSVICAPIRRGKKVFGLIHLYSTASDRLPDPDDLEFTLAVADTVAVALQNLSRRQELAENLNQIRDENLQLRERLGVQSEIVGKSRAMARVTEEIARAAPTSATVLIRGESGVGKELVARAVHFSSPRRKGAFVCLNCAALSESLLESELFGHERGAFTGAVARKIGKFEASHQGTLMLDEIGEMSPTIQAKFLRVLEGHPFERVGGSEPVKVDVRVIAATNRDLEKDVAEGRFRRDLYFRLHVLEIYVPPLRKRPEDIPELAHYFFHKYNLETGRRLRGFTPEATEQMLRYRWPGNVRELKNVVERAVVLAEGEFIDQGDVMLSKLPTTGDTGDLLSTNQEFKPISLAEMERRHILATLKSTGWNKSQTAHLLGIERSTLDRKIRRYELAEFSPGRGA
ncbi:MAG: sigma-54-dependent Fis family transcriptional regulator [Planctomycetia bacterium 21-64-5]|nr:MAG: sigma-54-dependent Fis family transcriptional regulator [Planctomycetia bacterium 21-64-5]HQU45957.1 sigma 54-interacting transcriptional regulator [Pirellulales bacterium]